MQLLCPYHEKAVLRRCHLSYKDGTDQLLSSAPRENMIFISDYPVLTAEDLEDHLLQVLIKGKNLVIRYLKMHVLC